MTITISDALLIMATFLGPIAAVQAQKWIERGRDAHNSRLTIFQTLMATRAMRASSADHVQALNLIDVFFNRKQDREIREAWQVYLDFLNQRPPVGEDAAKAHNDKGVDYLVGLLELIAKVLGYDFNKVHLKRGGYYPGFHATGDQAKLSILDSLAKILVGQKAVPMSVVSFPVSDESLRRQNEVQDALLETLAGKKPLMVVSNVVSNTELGRPP